MPTSWKLNLHGRKLLCLVRKLMTPITNQTCLSPLKQTRVQLLLLSRRIKRMKRPPERNHLIHQPKHQPRKKRQTMATHQTHLSITLDISETIEETTIDLWLLLIWWEMSWITQEWEAVVWWHHQWWEWGKCVFNWCCLPGNMNGSKKSTTMIDVIQAIGYGTATKQRRAIPPTSNMECLISGKASTDTTLIDLSTIHTDN